MVSPNTCADQLPTMESMAESWLYQAESKIQPNLAVPRLASWRVSAGVSVPLKVSSWEIRQPETFADHGSGEKLPLPVTL